MTNTQTNNATNDLRHIIETKDVHGNTMRINIRLNDECKNGHQDFSITANIWTKDKPRIDKYWLGGGCRHDEILKAHPELKIFVDLHLCDYKGTPIHCVANGFYHLQQGFNFKKPDHPEFKKEYCEYYRITEAQFDALNTSENKIQFAMQLQHLGILNQWEEQANKAIKTLEEMTGKTFMVDSRRTQFAAPTQEEIEEEERKQKEGYYTPATKEERLIIEKAKQHDKLRAEMDAEIKKIQDEYNIKMQVLSIGGKIALDNCIYHSHIKQLAFNWRSYDNLSHETVNNIISKLHLPDGVTVVNEEGK